MDARLPLRNTIDVMHTACAIADDTTEDIIWPARLLVLEVFDCVPCTQAHLVPCNHSVRHSRQGGVKICPSTQDYDQDPTHHMPLCVQANEYLVRCSDGCMHGPTDDTRRPQHTRHACITHRPTRNHLTQRPAATSERELSQKPLHHCSSKCCAFSAYLNGIKPAKLHAQTHGKSSKTYTGVRHSVGFVVGLVAKSPWHGMGCCVEHERAKQGAVHQQPSGLCRGCCAAVLIWAVASDARRAGKHQHTAQHHERSQHATELGLVDSCGQQAPQEHPHHCSH